MYEAEGYRQYNTSLQANGKELSPDRKRYNRALVELSEGLVFGLMTVLSCQLSVIHASG